MFAARDFKASCIRHLLAKGGPYLHQFMITQRIDSAFLPICFISLADTECDISEFFEYT